MIDVEQVAKHSDCVHYELCRDLLLGGGKLLDDKVKCDYYMEKPKQGECNQCRYYEGVHGVQGHAPCSFWGIGGVLWSDYCSRFEKEGDEK